MGRRVEEQSFLVLMGRIVEENIKGYLLTLTEFYS